MNSRSVSCFETSLGWMAIESSSKGLCALTLPCKSRKAVLEKIEWERGRGGEWATKTESFSPPRPFAPSPSQSFIEITAYLNKYFSGDPVSFDQIKLDLSQYTKFQRRVWNVTRLIPYGEIRTYSWIAKKIGSPKASRAVGNALGTNPIPIIIPCHRVIRADGHLGGFTGGLNWKKRLLGIERIR